VESQVTITCASGEEKSMAHQTPQKIEEYKRTITDYWTRDSSFYDNYPEHGLTKKEEQLWKVFFESEIGEKPLKILDVGTGTGSISLILSGLGHDVTGIDISEGMLAECERKAGERGLSLTFQVGDAEALPFGNQSFDMVTSRWVLWTLLRPDVAISEWMRVLRPGGRILAFDIKTHSSGNTSIPVKIRQSLSRMLISIQDGRRLRSYSYNREIYDSLPLSYKNADSFSRQISLFKIAGLDPVQVKEVTSLSAMTSETLEKPWRYRLGWKGYGDWHCISGMKKVT
jgi:ubiquinone/menaquinone biosynthesis C-methylase UbiE